MIEDIKKAVEALQNGEIILYPTDTIWGLGCDATNEEAVEKIYKLKQRSDSKSMLVLVDSANRIPQYVDVMPDIAWDLIELTTKPLTIIYPKAKNLAQNLVAEDGSIGIRVASDEFCQKLIQRFKKPIVSTSANMSGELSPANFQEISKPIRTNVDYIVEHRQDDYSKSLPSGIIKLEEGGLVKVIRE